MYVYLILKALPFNLSDLVSVVRGVFVQLR